MLNIQFYQIEQLINGIAFISVFFIMMKKAGYKQKLNIKNFQFINVALIFLIVRVQIKFYISLQDIIILGILLTFICRIFYSLELKKSFVYSMLYILIYEGIKLSLEYIVLYIFTMIDDKFNIQWNMYFDVFEVIVKYLVIYFIAYKFDKLKNLGLNKKYCIYIGITLFMNMLIILFLNKASNTIYNLYDIIDKNKVVYDPSIIPMGFIHFGDLALPYIIIVSSVVFTYMVVKLIKYTQEKARYEVINEKLEIQYSYYLNIKDSQEKVKRIYHDINNHISNIKAVQNNNNEVDAYIHSINEEVKDFDNIYDTKNILLDVILNEKSKVCNEKGIDLLCNIDFSKCDFIEMIDVSSIFSNLLDNAIEACEKIENEELKKYINLRGTIVKSYYIINCENSKSNKVILKNNKILTSKKDKYFHGIGIDSIKSSLKKYDGELDIQVEENKFKAIIYIPLA